MSDPQQAPRWHGDQGEILALDGVPLSFGRALPQNIPKGGILLIHGIASHRGWYEEIAKCLAELGYAVIVPDRRGSGTSGGPRGHAPNSRQLCSDLKILADDLRRQLPQGVPLIALGISLGAVLCLATALRHPRCFDALFLATPALDSRTKIKKRLKLKTFFRALIQPTAFRKLPFDADDLTPCTKAQRQVQNDPLRLEGVSARMALAIFSLRRYVRRHLGAVKLPIGLLFAAEDRLVDNDKVVARFLAVDPPRLWMDTYEQTPHFLHATLPPETLAHHVREWAESGAFGPGPVRRTTRRSTQSTKDP